MPSVLAKHLAVTDGSTVAGGHRLRRVSAVEAPRGGPGPAFDATGSSPYESVVERMPRLARSRYLCSHTQPASHSSFV